MYKYTLLKYIKNITHIFHGERTLWSLPESELSLSLKMVFVKMGFILWNLSKIFGIIVVQVLTDVLAEVDTTNKVDVRTEEPEQTTVRLLTMLRVLKYKPSSETNVWVDILYAPYVNNCSNNQCKETLILYINVYQSVISWENDKAVSVRFHC